MTTAIVTAIERLRFALTFTGNLNIIVFQMRIASWWYALLAILKFVPYMGEYTSNFFYRVGGEAYRYEGVSFIPTPFNCYVSIVRRVR